MIYLILDTNIWLYLANGVDPVSDKHHGNHHFEFLAKLEDLQTGGDICVLVNDIIIEEWQRNKNHTQTTINKLKKKFQNPKNAFSELSKYVSSNLDSLNQEYLDGITEEIRLNEEHIQKVEAFLYTCMLVPILDQTKLMVFELALNATAPFHNMKNNVADAAILFSSDLFLNTKLSDDDTAILISNNIDEFTDGKNYEEFHPDIKGILTANIQFRRILPAALKLSEQIIKELEEYYRQEEWLSNITFSCKTAFCESQKNYTPIGYLDQSILVRSKREYLRDPNQLLLFPEMLIPNPDQYTDYGDCSFCNADHFVCISCGELVVMNFDDNEAICEDCHVRYELLQTGTGPILLLDDIVE